MKSPITGNEMTLAREKRSIEFRKEKFEVVFHYFHCGDSGERFTTTSLDELNMNQVYNQYRDLYNIPFPDEIIRIREKYGVPAGKMSEILGFGINGYRQYEAGEMPSVSNAKLLQLAGNPQNFLQMVSLCDTLDEKTKEKYSQKARHLIDVYKQNSPDHNLKSYLFGNPSADIYSGYRNPCFQKFTEMVVFFAEQMEPFKTKMNKLLFYADFLMFKQICFSISGVRYKAINMGPVPHNFNSLFEYLANTGEIDIHYKLFSQGYSGEQFKPRKGRPFNAALFSEDEIKTLHSVADRFRQVSTNDIIEISHSEEAWKQNEQDKRDISYRHAFELLQV